MRRERSAAEYAVLGLLRLHAQGTHGYDLTRHFANDQPLGEVLRLEQGMLYHHLKQLEEAGLIVGTRDASSSRPARRVFVLTDRGQRALGAWLRAPVRHTREIRLDFLVKLYLLGRLAPDRVGELVQLQRDALQELLEGFTAPATASDASSTEDDDAAFLEQVRDLRRSQTLAAIAWLDRIAPE